MDDSERGRVKAAVEAAMRSFQAAERALDAEALLAHFARGPEFHVYDDGEFLDYETIRAKVHSVFPALRSIEGGFHSMHVFVLAPDAALAAGPFREAITDGDGTVIRVRGAASWLWRLTDDGWKIVYGQADHYPDEGKD